MVSGTVSSELTEKPLIGVSVFIPNLQTGTTTDKNGNFSIKLLEGSYKFIFSSIGFITEKRIIQVSQNHIQNVSLKKNTKKLDEIIIETNIEKIDIQDPQMSVNTLTSKTIKQIPVVLGMTDVIKALALLPGVSKSGEGAAGFHVRGGAADQNLVLLNKATLYKSSHLFGFFSVFNPDAIARVTLYKGGIPARYGGRISSVLAISSKKGDKKHFKATGGIGLVASRLLLEGPIVKNTASFIIGGRSSYAHLFLPLFDVDGKAYFNDLSATVDYKLNENNSILLAGYYARDVFSMTDNFKNRFGTSLLNFQWEHSFSSKIASNLSIIYSDYSFGLELDFVGFKYNSGIDNFNLKYNLTHTLSKNIKLRYGLSSKYYSFQPGEIQPNSETSGINAFKLTNKYAFENAVYVGSEIKITDKIAVQAGLRLSIFNRLGQDEAYLYANDKPVLYDKDLDIYKKATPIDTVSFGRSTTLKSFANLEPRFSVSYQLNKTSSIKASYNRMSQYIHLISNTSSPTPFDLYAPSGKYIKPQIGDQVALGYYKLFDGYSLQVEGYYKTVKNRLDYIPGADLIANNAVEQILLNGETRSYGLEFLLKKTKGRFRGWIAYTLSKSEQRTPGRTAQETGINNGEWYNTAWDRPHDISVTGTYSLSEKWSFGANFIFQTGRPTTFPSAQYIYNGITVPVYEARNSSRLSSFHHLDISATWTPKPHSDKPWKSEWVFGIYNVYNRMNASSISFGKNEDTLRNEAVRLSIFGIIPSITYNFKF